MEGHGYTLKLNLAQLLRLHVAFHTLPLVQWKATLSGLFIIISKTVHLKQFKGTLRFKPGI